MDMHYWYLNSSSYIYKVTPLRTCRPIGAPHDLNEHAIQREFLIDARAF
jgi:hypothetical protein